MTTRRTFLASSGAALTALYAGPQNLMAQNATGQSLTVGTRTLDVQGKAATVFGITNNRGGHGLDIFQSDGFDVQLHNAAGEPTVIHWHGLTPPFALDGSNVSQAEIPAGGTQAYRFALPRAGTNWMHSHHGLQEANLLAAPLIVRADAERELDRQDITLMLHDFSFTPAEEILAGLKGDTLRAVGSGVAALDMGMMRSGAASMPTMDHSKMNMAPMDHSQMNMQGGTMDLNDVVFDAYLANDRDLTDPEIVQVERSGALRLRVINAASSTNFWLDLGQLTGTLVAVDGMDVAPVFGRRFEIAMAQRLDFDLSVTDQGGAFPVLAQREGDRTRTGIILATAGSVIDKLPLESTVTAAPVLLDLERQLTALDPMVDRSADRNLIVDLTGDMMGYVWGINGAAFGEHTPLSVASGERVELTLRNQTMMSHPMHLHGHHFQVIGLGQARFAGAMRDTVMVPAGESVTIRFDANNPGEWPLHCHNAYHLAAGMMTTITYV